MGQVIRQQDKVGHSVVEQAVGLIIFMGDKLKGDSKSDWPHFLFLLLDIFKNSAHPSFRRRTRFQNRFSSINFRRAVLRQNAEFFNRFFSKSQSFNFLVRNAVHKRRKSANWRRRKTMDPKNDHFNKTRVSVLHKKNPSRLRRSNRTFVLGV